MKFAAGAWAFVIGYALVYTGVSFFVGGTTTSLASSLGLSGPLQANAKTATNPTTTSTLH